MIRNAAKKTFSTCGLHLSPPGEEALELKGAVGNDGRDVDLILDKEQ